MTVAWFVTMGWLGRLVEEMRMEGGAAGAKPEDGGKEERGEGGRTFVEEEEAVYRTGDVQMWPTLRGRQPGF